VQLFVWPGITFSWQAQYFRQVDWKNRKTHWHEAGSLALNPSQRPFQPFWLAASRPSGSATHRRLPSYAPFFSSLFQLFRGQGRPDALLCCTRIRQHPNAFGFNSVNHFKF
jgi:hypothetical protein